MAEKFEDRSYPGNAGLIATAPFKPVLRSRGQITAEAETLAGTLEVIEEVEMLLEEGPTGTAGIPTFSDTLPDIERLEEGVGQFEEEVDKLRPEL